ncbi:MAG TPA: class I SAM-dependent RNA methyltransferase, partial [Phycisphaerae bacterium]|nr:class I SAM-dependent RNA methyltransferase [Phycisphaerae bacterium]
MATQSNDLTTIRVTCAPGLAPYLEQELAALGYAVQSAHDTAVEITGTLTNAMRLNLDLRTANHVLMLLSEFPCLTPDDLYRHASFVEWERLLSPDGYVSVTAGGDSRAIDNWTYAGLKVKDAIVDRIASVAGRRPDAGPDRNRCVINCYWVKDRCWLYLNTSGQKLSDRGYRKIPHKAPMRETLAAGVLMAAGYDGSQPLVNPMCGSGTLAIEAALIAAGRAPGLLRSNFGFMHTLIHDEAVWQTVRHEAHERKKAGSLVSDAGAGVFCTKPPSGRLGERLPAPCPPIIATDIDDRAIRASEQNARTAGVEHLIRFKQCDFAETPIPEGQGIIVLNPE